MAIDRGPGPAGVGTPADTLAANKVVVTPAGGLAATDVQAALEELDSEHTAHLNDDTAAHAASAISVTPAGGIAADDVQAALEELQSEKTAAADLASTSDTTKGDALVGVNTGDFSGTLHDYLAVTSQVVSNLTALKALTAPSTARTVYMLGRTTAGDGGQGIFRWVSGDQSANVTIDPAGAIWVPPNSDPTGAGGAWKRQFSGAANVKWWGALGDGSGDTLATQFASLAEARAVYPHADALTQTIDWAAGRAANDTMWKLGGGAVYWPTGHYVATGQDSILIRPFVENFGDGFSSFLDFRWNVFFSDGMMSEPNGYGSYTWRDISAVAAGDNTVTLNNAAHASDFTAGGLAVLRSTNEDATNFPSFVELVKIVAVDAVTGVLTLEEPVEDAVASAQIGVPPDNSTNPLPEGSSIHHLRLKGDYTVGSAPIRLHGGIYKGHFHHLWTEGKHVLIGNGFTKSIFESIIGVVRVQAGDHNFLVIEAKSGSYKSTFRDIKAVIINEDSTADFMSLISVGERSRNLVFRDIEILAPSLNAYAIFSSSTAVRNDVRGLNAIVNNAEQGILLQGSGISGFDILPTRNKVSDVRLEVLQNFGIGVSFSDTSSARERGDDVSNVRIYGTPASVNGIGPNSIAFGGVSDCHVRDCVIPGPYVANTESPTDCHLYGCITDGPIDLTTRINVTEHDCRATGATAPPSPTQIINEIVTETTANNVVGTLTVPANYPWRAGDRVKFRIAGLFNGTADVKNVGIGDTTGALYTLSVDAGTTGPFVIEAEAVVIFSDSANINYRLTGFSMVGATTAVINALTSGTVSNAYPFNIEAWVANASDNVIIFQGEIQFARVEDSLSDGSTGARS